MVSIQETYSSPLVNFTEARVINNIEYTRVYTELNTNLNVGDYVYILNGNYDNIDLNSIDGYQSGSTGYKILEGTPSSNLYTFSCAKYSNSTFKLFSSGQISSGVVES